MYKIKIDNIVHFTYKKILNENLKIIKNKNKKA